MSIASTLAFLIAAAVRLPKSDIDKLTRERDEARLEADRWRALARRWEVRYEEATRPNQEALAQYQQAMAQAQAMQMHQNMMMAQNAHGLGMLSLGNALQHVCNCAPARHDMLLRS